MPRLTFDISDEIHAKLSLIPYGSRKRVLVLIVENLALQIERDPVDVITKLLNRTLELSDMLGTKKEK